MDGVILFADDQVFENGSMENRLFQEFNKDGIFSILPIDKLSILEKTISSVSTFRAIILDWNFKKGFIEEDVSSSYDNPHSLLKDKRIFSLVYIYSQSEISSEIKEDLIKLYPGKIFFELKGDIKNIDREYTKIVEGIERYESKHKHLKTPFIWSQAINNSVQNIFEELEKADPNWIKEIYNSANIEGADPNIEVISVFQNLLNESIIQNEHLTKSLDDASKLVSVHVSDKEESSAKLYNRIYYTQIISSAPIMTGDIFKIDDDEFAILITPECDMRAKKDKTLEFLKISKNESDQFISKRKKKKDTGFFNNGVQRRHILPSFPFKNGVYNITALIDFETAFIVKSKDEFNNLSREYKLNSPYIFQLRQRYLAYLGRVGVPAIPESLKLFNLK